MRTTRSGLLLAVLAASTAGCFAKNPATGKVEVSLYSDADEVGLGAQAAPGMIQQSGGHYRDPALSAYIDEIGQKLVASCDRPFLPPGDRSFRYRFHVLNTSQVNAFALPGGQVFVTRGILARLSDEAELAAVLGHEIGHVCARHGVHHMQSALGLELLLKIGRLAFESRNPDAAGVDQIEQAARVGTFALRMKYSRDDERQSDELGMKYAGKAGWDPRAMARVQEMLRSLQQREPGAIEALFSSHPPSDERAEEARRYVARRFEGVDLDRLETGRERYLDRTAAMRRNRTAYDAYDQGMRTLAAIQGDAAKRETDEGKRLAAEAHALFRKAIEADPSQAPFHAAEGQLLLLEGKGAEARAALERAASLDPSHFESALLLGAARLASRDLPGARDALVAACALHPAHPGPYYLLGRIAEEEGIRNEAVRHYRRAEAAGPDTAYGKDAAQRRARLEGPRLR